MAEYKHELLFVTRLGINVKRREQGAFTGAGQDWLFRCWPATVLMSAKLLIKVLAGNHPEKVKQEFAAGG